MLLDGTFETAAAPPSDRPAPPDQADWDALWDVLDAAGATVRERGRFDLKPSFLPDIIPDHDRWELVIERRAGREASARILGDVYKWFATCLLVGQAEAARAAWATLLLDLPAPQ